MLQKLSPGKAGRVALRVALRGALAGVLACALSLVPQLAAAEEGVDEAIETTTSVAVPSYTDRTIYVLGETAPVSATVRALPAEGEEAPGPPRGSVEFFDGDLSLGTAAIVADGALGLADLETELWPASGARDITAVFTPEEGSAFDASISAAQTYRIVDTTRMIPDIGLQSDAEAEIDDASLEWTIGNIWFSNFRVGFEREVLGGSVTLPDIPHPGAEASDEALQEYYFRPFTFSRGSGGRDAEGNRVISFEGAARLTSGSANQWNFADPQVHISPSGDGYVTAEFTGFYLVGSSRQDYGPVRVTIATFSDADIAVSGEGAERRVEVTSSLNWEGQAQGAGTWFYDYDDSFPNEFVALLNPLVAPFFARSAVATDTSKIPHPIALSFTESVQEGSGPEPEPDEPGPESPGPERPSTDDAGSERSGSAGDESGARGEEADAARTAGLAATGWPAPGVAAAFAMFVVMAVLGGGALLARRRH